MRRNGGRRGRGGGGDGEGGGDLGDESGVQAFSFGISIGSPPSSKYGATVAEGKRECTMGWHAQTALKDLAGRFGGR